MAVLTGKEKDLMWVSYRKKNSFLQKSAKSKYAMLMRESRVIRNHGVHLGMPSFETDPFISSWPENSPYGRFITWNGRDTGIQSLFFGLSNDANLEGKEMKVHFIGRQVSSPDVWKKVNP